MAKKPDPKELANRCGLAGAALIKAGDALREEPPFAKHARKTIRPVIRELERLDAALAKLLA